MVRSSWKVVPTPPLKEKGECSKTPEKFVVLLWEFGDVGEGRGSAERVGMSGEGESEGREGDD